MRERIVPVERTDLMNLYYTMLAVGGTAPAVIEATNPAEFTIAADGFCEEPLKTATVTATSGTFYFVPSFDFVGFTYNDAAVVPTGDEILADGRTLYKGTISSGGKIAIAKVSM